MYFGWGSHKIAWKWVWTNVGRVSEIGWELMGILYLNMVRYHLLWYLIETCPPVLTNLRTDDLKHCHIQFSLYLFRVLIDNRGKVLINSRLEGVYIGFRKQIRVSWMQCLPSSHFMFLCRSLNKILIIIFVSCV